MTPTVTKDWRLALISICSRVDSCVFTFQEASVSAVNRGEREMRGETITIAPLVRQPTPARLENRLCAYIWTEVNTGQIIAERAVTCQ